MKFAFYIVLILTITSLGAKSTKQCLQIYNPLIPSTLDYIYRKGTVHLLAPKSQLQYFDCLPETKQYSPSVVCQWWINSVPRPCNTFTYGFVCRRNGCLWYARPWAPMYERPDGGSSANFTCLTYNKDTNGSFTSMSYITYSMAGDDRISPSRPKETRTYYADLGENVNATCDFYFGRSITVIQMAWYKEISDGLVDVRALPYHYVPDCESKKEYWWSLTMIITNVTLETQTGSYVCKVNRSDYTSPFAVNIDDLPLHSMPLGQEFDPLSVVERPYYTAQNISLKVDPSSMPVTALQLNIRPHPILLLDYALYIAIGAVAAVIMIVAISGMYGYRRRYALGLKIKHDWNLTSDIEDTSYEFHVVVIYPEIGEETQFVQNELLGFLENQWKYKACVPQRDHDIGAVIADAYITSLNTSQRSLFILTEEIFRDEWQQYALYTALSNHRNIIIIKKASVDFNQLIETLGRHYSPIESALKVTTTIDWLQDEYKWERLRLALPAREAGSSKRRFFSCLL